MRKMLSAIATLIALSLLTSPTSLAAPSELQSGLVVTVNGDVKVLRGKGPQPITEGFLLQPEDILVAKWGGECSGYGLGGERFDLKGPSQLVFDAAPEIGTLDKITAWVSKQICEWSGKRKRQAILSGKGRDWKSELDVPSLLIPAPDGQVRASRAIFRWTAAGPAKMSHPSFLRWLRRWVPLQHLLPLVYLLRPVF